MAHKEMVYIKGFAKGKGYFNTLKMINLATRYHEGQFRNSGEPYIEHPMRVTSALIALGIQDDITLAAALGHDIIEDTNVSPTELVHKYHLDQEVVNIISLLSKNKEISTNEYYDRIKEDIRAILIKLSDRSHNISTMMGAFTVEKMKKYVEETENYVLPLCKYGKDYYPEYSDQIFTLKYHIESVLKAIKGFIENISYNISNGKSSL